MTSFRLKKIAQGLIAAGEAVLEYADELESMGIEEHTILAEIAAQVAKEAFKTAINKPEVFIDVG